MDNVKTEWAWLATKPSLDDMKTRHPTLWDATGRAFVEALESGGPARLAAVATESGRRARSAARQTRSLPEAQAALAAAIRHRMLRLAMEQTLSIAAAGGPTTTLGPLTGRILQALLFRRGLTRKPVSALGFRLLWPLLPRRRALMPLVQSKGIYCFYAKPLIRDLAAWIGDRTCVEIAAGDGTLAAHVTGAGRPVKATDSGDWTRVIDYPIEVERLDAVAALRKYAPRVVLCAWPPPGNDFERQVFQTASVESYVVFTSRHRFAAGDWRAYAAQSGFAAEEVPAWSRGLLPPDIDGLALRFNRRKASPAAGG